MELKNAKWQLYVYVNAKRSSNGMSLSLFKAEFSGCGTLFLNDEPKKDLYQ